MLCFACGTSRQKNNTQDWVPAIVKSYAKLAGCDKLLILEDGTKILPVDGLPKAYEHNQSVYIQYQKLDNMYSICMAEDFSAKIIAIKPDGKNKRIDCRGVRQLSDLPWISKYIEGGKIKEVRKYTNNKEARYALVWMDGSLTLFDCYGNELRHFDRINDPDAQALLNKLDLLSLMYHNKSSQQ